MKFIVDEPLPPALARWLEGKGHKADHIVEVGLAGSSDGQICQRAQSTGAVVVTKDEDYISLKDRFPGVQVLWVRIGNATNRALLDLMGKVWLESLAALQAGELIVEVAPPPPAT